MPSNIADYYDSYVNRAKDRSRDKDEIFRECVRKIPDFHLLPAHEKAKIYDQIAYEYKSNIMREQYLKLIQWNPPLTLGTLPQEKSVPKKVLDKQFRVGPIIGYRLWRYTDDMLKSVHKQFSIRPGQPIKACCSKSQTFTFDSAHIAPDVNCECGIYVWKTPDLMRQYNQETKDPTLINGAMAIWGKVIECQNGYRAEYAYPFKLFLSPKPMAGFPSIDTGIHKIAEKYGIGVEEI